MLKPLVPSSETNGRYAIPIVLGIRGKARVYSPEWVIETELLATVEPFEAPFCPQDSLRSMETVGCPISDEELMDMRTNPRNPMSWAEIRQVLVDRGIHKINGNTFGIKMIREWVETAAQRMRFMELRHAAQLYSTAGPNELDNSAD